MGLFHESDILMAVVSPIWLLMAITVFAHHPGIHLDQRQSVDTWVDTGWFRLEADVRLIRFRWLSWRLFQRQGRTHDRGLPGELPLHSNPLRASDCAKSSESLSLCSMP